MTEKTLKRYLNGEASEKERLDVLLWAEDSKENLKELSAYRSLYNAIIFNCDKEIEKKSQISVPKRRRCFHWGWAAITVAAIISGVFFGTKLQLKNNRLTLDSLSAPAGLITESILSDGTKVFLNAGSKLEIINYQKEERRVKINGEAYFDVARDEKRPFIVETGIIKVKVLGTAFNVNESENSVVLVRGSVQVVPEFNGGENHNCILTPGQRLIIDPDNRSTNIEEVNIEDYTSWINGYLKFDSIPIVDVIMKLQDYYSITIDTSSLRGASFQISGKLDLRVRVDTALVNLEFLAPVNFEKIAESKYKVMMK